MLEVAQAHGVNGEKIMWESVDDIENLLCIIKKHDKQAYWDFIIKSYGTLYSHHFKTDDFARWFIDEMHSTQMDGKELKGQYWSCEQVVEAYKSMGVKIPSDVTELDMWVAANAAKHDFGRKFDDSKVLEIAYLFYFADEDYPHHDKVFRYMEMVNSQK